MQLNELTNEELQTNLQRLHEYLNNKYFNGELSEVDILIQKCGGIHPSDNGVMWQCALTPYDNDQIIYALDVVTRYRLTARRVDDPDRLHGQWLIASMLHAMCHQYMYEIGAPEENIEDVAENIGLINYGTGAEWINPLRYSLIVKECPAFQHV